MSAVTTAETSCQVNYRLQDIPSGDVIRGKKPSQLNRGCTICRRNMAGI